MSSQFRIAYIDANVRYHNRTRERFVEAVEQAGEVIKIGPGFSPPFSAVNLLKTLCESPHPPDVIVTTPHVALASAFQGVDAKRIAALYRRSFVFAFENAEFTELVELNREVRQTQIPRLLVLLEADYYNFTPETISAFRAVSDTILGFGPETWARKRDLPHLSDEKFAARATDWWADFLEAHGANVASFHHIIGEDEYCSVPLARRPYSWSVLGVLNYPARRLAVSTLRRNGHSPLISSPIRRALSALQRLKILPETDAAIDLIQREFQNRLRRSRYSYTCGSGLEMPVRKFFEIPAAGAVLVCRPFRGARALGFTHGENCVECEPQDLIEAHRFLDNDPDRAQAIADAGRNLIERKHSVAARAVQLRRVIAAAMQRNTGARWIDGEYRVLQQSPA